ncbi:helix-turn-helix transcriptional regulator [Comamonadaceae bacterium G21597-S1]|nr:helix-turn-helix transcriptional regulator [Comamonadaceae bacterium G21597-S1]
MLQAWKHASTDPDDSRQNVSRVLRRHRLRIKGPVPQLQTQIDHLGNERMSLTRLSYGSAVDVEPEPVPGFWVISLPLRGRVDVLAKDARIESRPGIASMISSDMPVCGQWDTGARQAVFRLHQDVLHEAADTMGARVDPLARRRPFLLAMGPHLGLLPGMLDALITLDTDRCTAMPHALLERQWNGLAELLAQAAVDTLSGRGQEQRTASRADDARLRRLADAQAWLVDAMQRHDLPDVHALAAHMGLSLRSLQELVRRHRGMTAYQFIEQVRLLRARHLLRSSSARVSEVALMCGFGHFGRFAAKYAAAFGVAPGQDRHGH